MARLTAPEARRIALSNLPEQIDRIVAAIAKKAAEHKFCLSTGFDYKEDLDLWTSQTMLTSRKQDEAIATLRELDYEVRFTKVSDTNKDCGFRYYLDILW